ncbi:hypothetical protein GPECTOR_11g277 [Gonium pectorale]|uniref:Uncharacterized protein n=1 Tax=Gonium pectorale TaxID=33097 RepID=A0A150GQ22_GONPE|nr:hypothetical protein GPECTOR_11g277 [Gonium pectorale]|eukprot:KXZ51838.1 hypothetical protein GPECTOR_11g277 [Gonium pectorale]
MRTSGSDSESEGDSRPAIQSALMGCSSVHDPGSASKPTGRSTGGQQAEGQRMAYGVLPFVFGMQGATGGPIFLPAGAGGLAVNLGRHMAAAAGVSAASGGGMPMPHCSGGAGSGAANSPTRSAAPGAMPAVSGSFSQQLCGYEQHPQQLRYAAPASSMGLPPRQPPSAAITKPAAPPPLHAAATSGPVISFARNGAPQHSSRGAGPTRSIGGGIVVQLPGTNSVGYNHYQQAQPTASTAKHSSPAPIGPPAKRQAVQHPAHSGPTGTVYLKPAYGHAAPVRVDARPTASAHTGMGLSAATASHYSVPAATGAASRRGEAACSQPCVADFGSTPVGHAPPAPASVTADVVAAAAALEVVDPDCDDPAQAFFSAWQGHDIDDLLTDLPPDVAAAAGGGGGDVKATPVRAARPGAVSAGGAVASPVATAPGGATDESAQLLTPTAATLASVLASEHCMARDGAGAGGGEVEGGGLSPGITDELFRALDLPTEAPAPARAPARPAPSTATTAAPAATVTQSAMQHGPQPSQPQATQVQQAQSRAPSASQQPAASAAPVGVEYSSAPPGYPPMYPPWPGAPYGYPPPHMQPPHPSTDAAQAQDPNAAGPQGTPQQPSAGSQPYPPHMYPGYPYPYPPYGYGAPPHGYTPPEAVDSPSFGDAAQTPQAQKDADGAAPAAEVREQETSLLQQRPQPSQPRSQAAVASGREGPGVSSYDDGDLLDLSAITAGLFSPPGSMVQATGSCRGGAWGAASCATGSRGANAAEETPSASTAAAAAAASAFAFTPIQAYAQRRSNPFAAPRGPPSTLRAQRPGCGDAVGGSTAPGSSARRAAATPRATGSPLDCALLASWLTSPANTGSLDMCVRLGLLGEEPQEEAGGTVATAAARDAVVSGALAGAATDDDAAPARRTDDDGGDAAGTMMFLNGEKAGSRLSVEEAGPQRTPDAESQPPAGGTEAARNRAAAAVVALKTATTTTAPPPSGDPDLLACIQITRVPSNGAGVGGAATAQLKACREGSAWDYAPVKAAGNGTGTVDAVLGFSTDGDSVPVGVGNDLERTVTLGAGLLA